ncbi:WD domain-containing protein, putative [Eimeria mitis]|uniref:WD domain-containing protein, putative n=1 Tax=Eimeria mitis TaxID=44415 RepID=U6JWG8_9EIME|nr:WD domain-containing protein, putative [Eimeria mitis]CDJ29126.1 WD domain-containing protein, putative [Eimeria mitis]
MSNSNSVQYPVATTHTGGQDLARQQVLIVDIAVDNDHELIAVCGRSIGKPASIYVYSSRTFERVRLCKAFSERGFSAASFRGKFSSAGTEASTFKQNSNTSKSFGDGALQAEGDSTPQNTIKQDENDEINATESSSGEVAAGGSAGGDALEEELYDSEQVPLLAVVGGSSVVHSEAPHTQQETQGEPAQFDKQPVLCHRRTISSMFRDPRNAAHIVSAGDDGQIKWWATHDVLEAVSYMTEESTIAVPVVRAFTMPDEMPIKRVLPHRQWQNQIRCVSVMPRTRQTNCPLFLFGSSDGVVRLCSASKKGTHLLMAIKTHACAVVHLAVDPTGQCLAVLGDDGVLLLLKLTQCHQREKQIGTEQDVEDLEDSHCVESRWQAEPLGFTTTPEPLSRLVWEHPLLLLGLAGDAALLVLTGLGQLHTQPGKNATTVPGSVGLVAGTNALCVGQKASVGDANGNGPSSEDSSDYTGDDGAQDEESDSADQDAENGAPLPQRDSALSIAEDPLDLTGALFFRQGQRIDVKIPTSVLRSIVPDGKDPREEEELNGSDSEADDASDHDTISSVASREAQPRGASSNGSLTEQSAAADETRRVLAAAMKQEQRRRAAAAAAAAAAARLTAITIARQLGDANRLALVAAAQSGAWWRCEFEYDIIHCRCKEGLGSEREADTDGPAKAEEDRIEAQNALRCGLTQQAEKHQQQQQFLRRLLMLDATTYDGQSANEMDAASNEPTSKKTKEPKPPCPRPVLINNILQVVSDEYDSIGASAGSAALSGPESLSPTDAVKDILQPEEPTITDLIARLTALPGINTQEMMMELILREDLLHNDEAEAARSLDKIERQIHDAAEQQQAMISMLARLFGGALEAVRVAGISEDLCEFLQDIQRLETAGQAQCTAGGAADMQAILEACRDKELRHLLLPEETAVSYTPSSTRRLTVEPEATKISRTQEVEVPGICNGPGSLVALTLQSEEFTGTPGAAPSTGPRRQRMLEMAALLKAQPKEELANAQDEQRIAETIKNLNACNLTASGTLSRKSLPGAEQKLADRRRADLTVRAFECMRAYDNRTMASRKKKQMVELAEWAAAKANSFNRRVKVLSQMRKELLRASDCILREISEALQAAELEGSAEFSQVQSLAQMVESATVEDQSDGSLWSISKEQLIDSLEGRLKQLNNTGALFESVAAKAEIEDIKAALAEARRRPGEFIVSFEHLHPAAHTRITKEPEAYFADVPGDRIDTSTERSTSAASDEDQKLKERLLDLIHSLRRCEISQSSTVQTALNLQECSKIYEHYYVDEPVNSGSLPPTFKSWAELQTLEIQLQANRSIQTVKNAVFTFDQEVRELLKDRTAVHQQLLLARLKQLEQLQELTIIETVEPRNVRLQQDLSSEQKECHQVNSRLEALAASISERRQGIESCRVVHKTAKLSASPHGGDAEASDLEDEVDEAEQLQGNSGDVEEDICPLGCDMAIYEALLEFRDQKTANDATLTVHQRELDELKREYAKVQGIQKQHAARYKSVEAAIHKFLRELQSSLNELETVVPLRASQIKCLSSAEETWQLPDKLDSAVIFSNEGFAALRQQVAELQHETTIVADDLKQLKRLLASAQRENKQSSQRLATLRATFKAVELVRFGASLTLEQVEAAAVAAGHEDNQARSDPIRPAFEKDMEMVAVKQAQLKDQQQQYMQLKQKLRAITKRHTELLHRFALARESDSMLTQQLQGEKRHHNTSDDGTFARMRLDELRRLKEMLKKSEIEIERLQALVVRMKTKGKLVHVAYMLFGCAHVDPSILWRRDPGVLRE